MRQMLLEIFRTAEQKNRKRAWVTDHLKEPLDNPEMTVSLTSHHVK